MAAALRLLLTLPLVLAAGCAEDPPPAAPPAPPSYAPPPGPAPMAAPVPPAPGAAPAPMMAPAPMTAPAPAPAPPPPAPPADPRAMVELPLSTTTSPVPSGMPRVVVSKQAIVLEGDLSSLVALPPPDRWANGVDAQYKRNGPNDLFLVPLGAALARARQGAAAPIAIGFDASIPYRIVVEVLFTAGQSEYAKYHLLTRTAAGFGAIVSEPPKVQDVRLVQPVALNLAVFVVPGGLVVKGAGGSMAPGCKDVGPGITLPRGAGGHDLAGLRACAASLRALDPRFAAETQATITANPDVPFGEIVAVMDALRVDPSGQVGFPDVHFGVAR